MTVVIAGGHGKIALLLGALLSADGSTAKGIIRNPAQVDDLRVAGIDPAVFDLEHDTDGLDEIVSGATAVVFAAGAGAGSGDARKETMDRDGAVKLIQACRATGVQRYVIVSSMGARDPDLPGDGFSAYLRAKAQADRAVAESGLDYTIIRPGRLLDEAGTGRIEIAEELPRGSIPRADVAATVAAALTAPSTIGTAFDLISGAVPIAEAIRAVAV